MNNTTTTKRGKGRPKKVQNVTYVPSVIDFTQVTKLNNLDIDPKMLESMPSGLGNMDKFILLKSSVEAENERLSMRVLICSAA